MHVPSPRDEIDDWLGGEVTPLNPPPGSLDRIRKRARQRKTRQAVLAAVGCAVVLAAGVTVPQLVLSSHGSGQKTPVAQGGQSVSTTQPTSSPATSSNASPDGSASSAPNGTALTTGNSGAPVPPNFQPTSVTVVGVGTTLVGAVIGQAGTPGHCTGPNPAYCTSLAGTSDYGGTWYGVSAPVTSGPQGSAGVRQLRFANLSDGWAFGPALWETSTGGRTWQQESTYGQRVIDVEAVPSGSALAVFATCSGTGTDYAASCTRFSLYSSAAGSTSWSPVSLPAGTMSTGQASSASLVISGGSTAYLLTPSGDLLSGSVSGGTWTDLGKAPCSPGGVQPNGQPLHAQLAAGSELMLVCEGQTSPTQAAPQFYTSTDGAHWTLIGSAPDARGSPTSLASASGHTVLATTGAIYYSTDNGKTWHLGKGSALPSGGYDFVGMTNGSMGVAVPDDAGLGEIFVTRDGGRTWTASPVSG